MRKFVFLLASLAASQAAHAAMGRIRFIVIDPATNKPVPDAVVTVQDLKGLHALTKVDLAKPVCFDLKKWTTYSDEPEPASKYTDLPVFSGAAGGSLTTIVIPLGLPVSIQTQDQIPTKEIYIKVTATRIRSNAVAAVSGGQTRDQSTIKTFTTTTGAGAANSLVQGQAGVASDSNGQQHVRGEHAEITYVVDGIPLPDTLSGRQGAIVVPSTVQNLDIIEGGFAPEFGGQTAAILNVTTLAGSKKFSEDVTLDGEGFNTFDGDLTAVGPLGKHANFTLDIQGSRTGLYQEPQQPNIDGAHNTGEYFSIFSKFRFEPSKKDVLSLTLSHNPDQYQDSNRAGLPASFADVGQGYGLFGLRNANGVLPQQINPGGFGSAPEVLPSQQALGMDINSSEENEFAVLSWKRQLSPKTSTVLSITSLHSGQSVTNNNPLVNQMALQPDSSIEYNPDVTRNAHHTQATGSIDSALGHHDFKAGFVVDRQTGHESYSIGAASQLALDELAALDPGLAPAGAAQMSGGAPVLDVYGNPVYRASSNVVPTVLVQRQGWYDAAYLQDTWKISKRLTANYGLRYDWYYMSESGQPSPVNKVLLSPRLNFSYDLSKKDTLRWSYNKLFNTPPLAQGALVGAPIVPETLDQYDVSIEHQLNPFQDLKLAYYAKQMRNQVDTGLLIPGSEIGLFSAVNFQYGGVHGVELTYDVFAPKGVGWDGYLNVSYSKAAPNGLDNTGAQAPMFNDHDQRETLGAGLAYTWKNQATAALVFSYGSGLASSIIRNGERVSRSETNLKYTSSPFLFQHHGGFGIDVENLFDDRTVINFQSGFSGTRFMEGRRIMFSLFEHF